MTHDHCRDNVVIYHFLNTTCIQGCTLDLSVYEDTLLDKDIGTTCQINDAGSFNVKCNVPKTSVTRM